jgi:hemerythrin
MALLTWSSKYSVGVPSMDSQHTVLFNILNELHDAMMNGHAHKLTGPLLDKLLSYTRTHFAAEEGILAAAGYPGLAEHRKIHRDLLDQVEIFNTKFKRGEGSINVQLLNFLRDWLTNHILKEDHGYSECVGARHIR